MGRGRALFPAEADDVIDATSRKEGERSSWRGSFGFK